MLRESQLRQLLPYDELDSRQQELVDRVDDLIESWPYPGLDRNRMTATFGADQGLSIALPHVSTGHELSIEMYPDAGRLDYWYDSFQFDCPDSGPDDDPVGSCVDRLVQHLR